MEAGGPGSCMSAVLLLLVWLDSLLMLVGPMQRESKLAFRDQFAVRSVGTSRKVIIGKIPQRGHGPGKLPETPFRGTSHLNEPRASQSGSFSENLTTTAIK